MEEGKFYEKRLAELTPLLHNSKSRAFTQLLEEAITLTKETYTKCKEITKVAQEKIAFYDIVKEKFDTAEKTVTKEMIVIKNAAQIEFLTPPTKQKVLDAYEAMNTDFKTMYDERVNANRMLRSAIDHCYKELNRTLLELIYKPNPSSFIADGIFAIFQSLATSWLPYSDKAEMVMELHVSKRKKDYLESGDKLMVYLEDYIAVLNTWIALSNQFVKEVLE